MIANNIFRWIGDFFSWAFSLTFDQLRLNDLSWWASNVVNWGFLIVLLVLFGYWMRLSLAFKKDGKEDKA